MITTATEGSTSRVGRPILHLAALIALTVQLAAAAGEHAQLSGSVQDPSGAVVVGATLAAVNDDTGIRRTAHTDQSGTYSIGALAPGTYKVTARKPGFQTLTRLNVQLAAGAGIRLDFAMRIGSISQVVTVEDAPKLLHLEDASVGVTAGRRLIDRLPLSGRGVLSLIELAPGVVATPASQGEAGQFSANGQRANTNAFTVDGVSANSGVTGSAVPAQFVGGVLPSMTAFGSLQNLAALDALDEVRIETSSFAPEFGRMPGAQVALITRSGSDHWHGSLAYAFRHEKLAANDWFANSRGYGRSAARLNQWTAAAGGPVRPGRTFFFAAWEGLRLRSPFAWLAGSPTEASRAAVDPVVRPLLDAFPLPTGRNFGGGLAELLVRGSQPARLDSGSLRLDHALTPHVELFGRVRVAPSSSTAGSATIAQSDFKTRGVTVGITSNPAATVTNDARVNVSSDSVLASWLPAGASSPDLSKLDLSRYLPAPGAVGQPLYGVAIGGVGQLLSGESGSNRQGQLELIDTLSWNRGAHALRFGVNYERLTPARESAQVAVAGVWPSLSSLLLRAPARTVVSQAVQASSLIEILSFFVQDTCHPISRLTLTWGARWEITPAPSIRQSGLATIPTPPTPLAATAPLWPTRYGQIAPRVGAAWRITERTVARAGWGIFYDLNFSAATDPINGFPYNRWQFGGGFAGGTVTSLPDSIVSPPTGLQLPYSHQWNAAIEHAFTTSDIVTLSYVGAAGRHLLRRESDVLIGAQIAKATNHGVSDFHSLELGYRRRLARGVAGTLAYTYGSSIDNGSWDSGVMVAGAQHPPSADRGASAFQVRHSATAALSYDFGTGLRSASETVRRLTADWEVESILRVRSGFPIDILSTQNLLGFGFDNYPRPDLAPGVPLWLSDDNVAGGRRLNPAAFLPARGPQGDLGRNAITGAGMGQVDLALRRRFPLGDAASVEAGLTAFNVLNHPNPGDPVYYADSPQFGLPVSMLSLMLGSGSPRSGLTPLLQSGGARSVELGVKVRF